MKIKPAVRTIEEIEQIVSGVQGTWIRRRNAKEKLIAWSNEIINEEIEIKKSMIRKLKAEGATNQDLRPNFAEITKLEMRIL